MGGPFEIVEIPASGAYGTVCVARPQSEPERLVALKVLRIGLSHNPKVMARSRDEARMLYRLRHPDIVQVEAMVEIAGRPVLVMEWVEGLPLDRLFARFREGLPFEIAVEIVRRAAGALHAAWESPAGPGGEPMRIIHRDIKPGNLMLAVDGRVKVLDFGIAHADFSDRESTTISTVMGSQNYIAPERIEGAPATPGIDVYALGILLFELLTARLLILPRDVECHGLALAKQVAHLDVPRLDESANEVLRDLVRRMCSRAVEYRPSALEVAATLQGLLVQTRRKPDLSAFAMQHVAPLYANRRRLPPRSHPDYAEVAFLEQEALTREDTALEPLADDLDKAEQRADRRVRRFLARPDWHERLRELRWLLAMNPRWTASPFVDVLGGATRPWWMFWAKAEPPARVAAALEILRHRRSADVLALAEELAAHEDASVAEAAQAVLAAAEQD